MGPIRRTRAFRFYDSDEDRLFAANIPSPRLFDRTSPQSPVPLIAKLNEIVRFVFFIFKKVLTFVKQENEAVIATVDQVQLVSPPLTDIERYDSSPSFSSSEAPTELQSLELKPEDFIDSLEEFNPVASPPSPLRPADSPIVQFYCPQCGCMKPFSESQMFDINSVFCSTCVEELNNAAAILCELSLSQSQ